MNANHNAKLVPAEYIVLVKFEANVDLVARNEEITLRIPKKKYIYICEIESITNRFRLLIFIYGKNAMSIW